MACQLDSSRDLIDSLARPGSIEAPELDTEAEAIYRQTLTQMHRWNQNGGGYIPELAMISSRLSGLVQSLRDDVRPLLALTWVYLRLEDLPRARTYLDRALQIDATHPLLLSFQQQFRDQLAQVCQPDDAPPLTNLTALRHQVQDLLTLQMPTPDGRVRTLARLRSDISQAEALRRQLGETLGQLGLSDDRTLLAPLTRRLKRLEHLLEQNRRLQELEAGLNLDCAQAFGLLHELRSESASLRCGQQRFSQLLNSQGAMLARLEAAANEGLDVRRLWQIGGDFASALDACRQALSELSSRKDSQGRP